MTEDRVPRTQAGRDMVAWQAGINGFDRAYWDRRVVEIEDQAAAQPAPLHGHNYGGDWIECTDEHPKPVPPLDVEALIADVLALEPPPVRRDTLRGWHDALAEASHLLRARLGSAPSRSEPDPLRPEHPYNGGTCCDQPEADHA